MILVAPPVDRVPYSVTCARTGPAAAFALLVFLVGCFVSSWHGRFAGAIAALSLVLMPRTFGHAHLAALETMVNLTCTAVVLYVADRWSDEAASVSWIAGLRVAAIAGLLFGLALLTKVQAILLPVPVALWAFWRLRLRALPLLAVSAFVALAVFFVCWPYLWSAPVEHLKHYLGRTTDRAVLYVLYFGKSIADRDVPWHYPWLMFFTTVPIGLQVLAAFGLCGGKQPAWKSPRDVLVLASMVFPLIVFSIPGIPVYDGERLFSNVFPLLSVFIGRGSDLVRGLLSSRFSARAVAIALATFLACQAYGAIRMAPCWLSYYNLAIGGLWGAGRLGLETSYWGDSVTRRLLNEVAVQVPAGESVGVAPVLYDGQWEEVWMQAPWLRAQKLHPVPVDAKTSSMPRYVLLFMRPAYLPEELRGPLDERSIVASVRRQGVLLAALLDRER